MRDLVVFVSLFFTVQLISPGESSALTRDYVTRDEFDHIGRDEDSQEVDLTQGYAPSGGLTFAFSAFGQSFDLQLQKNDKIISPTAQVISRKGDEIQSVGVKGSDCHFIHKGDEYVASISLCGNSSAHGYITTSDGRTFEIIELTPPNYGVEKRSGENDTSSRQNKMLKIKRTVLPPADNSEPFLVPIKTESKRAGPSRRIIEAAVFVDEAAIRKFDPFLRKSNENVRDFIVSYMNGVQSLYHHASLKGIDFDISIVRIELLHSQPSGLPTHAGERSLLLKSFCKYQSKENRNKNGEAGHWDIGIYVSGLDFYAVSGGRTSMVTMGLSAVDAICTNDYNCVIAELGTTNYKNKPYPSSGFTSVYVLAHELGHNLGLHHDGKSGNSCPKNGFIMSASRGTKGESTWSACSADKLRAKEHLCLQNDPAESEYPLGRTFPGQKWNSNRQCQIFLLDPEARTYHTADTLSEICHALKCKTDNRLGIYRAGPALEGTHCGEGKWCRESKCVKSEGAQSSSSGSWSDWTKGPCQSSCTVGSKGLRKNTRTCSNPLGTCKGKSTDVELCDDSSTCSQRMRVKEYANEACGKFKAVKPNLIANGEQAKYNEKKSDLACNIYCENKLSSGASQWYSPVLDFNDNPELDAHFPDGTLCHVDDSANRYYCLKHNCILEGARSGKSAGIDININQNAKEDDEIPESLKDFFSLNKDLTPIKTSLTKEDLGNADHEEEIEDDDVFVF